MRARVLIFLFLTLILLISCKSQAPLIEVPMKTVERRVTTLVPFYMPSDSSMLRVWLECDSMNNVLIKSLDEQKTQNMSSDLSLKDGLLEYGTKTHPDTVYLPSDTIYIYKDVPVRVEVEKEVNALTRWQKIRMRVGDISLALLLVFGIWKLAKLKL